MKRLVLNFTNMLTATTSVALNDVISLFKDVASLNLGYLAVSVTILTLLAGAFYLFNFRPLQEELKGQEEDLKGVRKQIETEFIKLNDGINLSKREALDNMEASKKRIEKDVLNLLIKTKTDLTTEFNEAKNKLIGMERRHKMLELQMIWDAHYLWKVSKVHTNELYSLMEYLEKTLEYKMEIVSNQLFLEVLNDVLDEKLDLDQKGKGECRERLINAFGKIVGLKDEKSVLIERINKVLS